MKTFKNLELAQSLPASVVNIEDKSRSNLFTWRGQFSPQLIEQLLLNYAKSNYSVFDPFLGSGTVLYECALLGLKASGTEINQVDEHLMNPINFHVD
ncbi:MAG: DNA methyltransferase, partial [Candidatus Thiodiazotropha sp.]